MRNYFFFLIVIIAFASCTPNAAKIDSSLQRFFDSAGVRGTFSMMDNQKGDVTVYNIEMDTARLSPEMIFKVMATLTGVQAGVIFNQNFKLAVDSAASSDSLSLKEAFKSNNAAYFSKLSQIIGKDTLELWIDSIKYGNMNVAGAAGEFWRNGSLQISPDEQLGLMFKIYFDKLPFPKYAQEMVRNLMQQEDNTMYRLHYAAAAGVDQAGASLAWVTGWVEENRHVYFFVTFIKGNQEKGDLKETAEAITRNILRSKGFFKGLM